MKEKKIKVHIPTSRCNITTVFLALVILASLASASQQINQIKGELFLACRIYSLNAVMSYIILNSASLYINQPYKAQHTYYMYFFDHLELKLKLFLATAIASFQRDWWWIQVDKTSLTVDSSGCFIVSSQS